MIERTIGFIGAGVMAEAFARGLLDAGLARRETLYASDPSAERRQVLAALIGRNALADNLELVRRCRVVVLSVKPHMVSRVGAEIAGALTPEHLVVSIAAGVPSSALAECLRTKRLVRVMPNTPALVRAGASAYCAGEDATADDLALVEQMLGALGLCVRVDESQMDAVTGLSGSGPAYVYMMIEALSDGGVHEGLPRAVALKLAAQTVLGAARMVLETGKHPGELKDQVTTPGGTTIEAVRVLEASGMRRAFIEAVAAAAQKARTRLDQR